MNRKKSMDIFFRVVYIYVTLALIIGCMPILGKPYYGTAEYTGPGIYDGHNTCTQKKPKLCPYYKSCCSLSQYCSDRSRACEPCFPSSENRQDLLNMCQTHGVYDVTWLSHQTCVLACLGIFTYEELFSIKNATYHGSTVNASNRLDTSDELQKCEELNRELIISLAVVAVGFFAFVCSRVLKKCESVKKYVYVASIHGNERARNSFHRFVSNIPRLNSDEEHIAGEEKNNRQKSTQVKSDQTTDLDSQGATGGYENEEQSACQKLLSKFNEGGEIHDTHESDDGELKEELESVLNKRTYKKLAHPRTNTLDRDEPKEIN